MAEQEHEYRSTSTHGRVILTAEDPAADETVLHYTVGPVERHGWELAHPGEFWFNNRFSEGAQMWAIHNHLSRSGKFDGTLEELKTRLLDIETRVEDREIPKELRDLLA